ncbi:MAG TPA: hypothetical protein VFL98_00245 [Candidatus Paceibacterota bacterium]|nr:hypothetical protein [Candidatus Paceibacterota bacterium]
MNRVLLSAGVLLVALGVAIAALLLAGSPAEAPVPSAQRLAAIAYPLYPSLSWGAEQPSTQAGVSGYAVSSRPVVGVSDIASTTEGFVRYYQSKLAADGWSVDNSLAAGGPGADVAGYRKGNAVFIYAYSTDFKGTQPGEPVSCPCDVTFTLFSSEAAH